MFEFTDSSAIVQLYVRKVKAGLMEREDVPALFNLQEVVYGILDAEE